MQKNNLKIVLRSSQADVANNLRLVSEACEGLNQDHNLRDRIHPSYTAQP